MIDPASITDPTSGTDLGLVLDAVVERVESKIEIVAAEFGIEPVEGIWLGERWAFAFSLRGWSDDAYATLFPNTFAGSVAGRIGLRSPGTFRAGNRLSGRSVVLRFTPDDPANQFGVVVYRAIPWLAETVRVDFANDSEVLLEAGFVAIRDATGRIQETQLVEDMTP